MTAATAVLLAQTSLMFAAVAVALAICTCANNSEDTGRIIPGRFVARDGRLWDGADREAAQVRTGSPTSDLRGAMPRPFLETSTERPSVAAEATVHGGRA